MNIRLNLILLAAALAAQPVFAQGSLTPPGAPAAMMKTLTQVEPRTAITNVPYTITQPGSYYLATNMVSAAAGVTIATNWVTLDLMGFTLAGNRSGGGHGIWIYSGGGTVPVQGVTVCNGSIRGFSYGIQARYSQGARFVNLAVSSNLNYGLNLDGLGGTCDGNLITDSTFTGNGLAAIHLDGSSGQCNGNRLADCTLGGNVKGIELYVASTNGQCDGNAIVGCTVSESTDTGIELGYADGNRVENNHVATQAGGAAQGIDTTTSQSNLFLRNFCTGNFTDFTVDANDTYGPVVTNSGELATSGASFHPWANFTR